MDKQIIITINRSYGSGGHEIGRLLAKRLGIDFMDRSLLDSIAKEKNVDAAPLRKYDEKTPIPFLSRTVRGINNSPEEAVAEMQFAEILKKAKSGASFVLIGRCGDQVLKDYPNLATVFICGDMDARIERIMEVRKVDKAKARSLIRKHDRTRRAYHNQYASRKWNDLAAYDLTLNSTRLGLNGTVDMLEAYLARRHMIPGREEA